MFATTLTTERLTLRPPSIGDAPAIYERYASDPEVTRFLSWKTHRSVEETVEFVEKGIAEAADSDETRWAICLQGDPWPWGMISAFVDKHRVTLGYVLSRAVWGRGIVSEATAAVIQETWRHDRFWRVQAYCHVDNIGSARVLEKCGMLREGLSRKAYKMPQTGETPQDCYWYATVRETP